MTPPAAAAPVHTTYLWHMHQPIYWPERSTWNGRAYEHAYETITLGHSQSDESSIFNSDDRVHDYQDYPKTALATILDVPDAGAQVSFATSLIQNVSSLAAAGWNGGRYAPNWYQPYRDAHAWTTSGGRPRLDLVVVASHHPIAPLVDETVFRRMIQVQKAVMPAAWGDPALSAGFFPAETAFSERMIPALVAEGISWCVVPDVHIARACADYPWVASQDNCDPPNPADQGNPAQGYYYQQTISRGVTTRVPVPYGLRPHRAQHVDPATGAVSSLVVVPAANGMSWNEGYALYGTGEIDAIASRDDPAKPMLVLFAHDGDNAWSGGYSYFTENVTQFAHAAAAKGYEPTTIAEYLADHPVAADDVVRVEDGAWVNADGDFGSPQFVNWNWPLVSASGQFDIPNGWAEDERNWAVLVAATNRVLTAEEIAGPPVASRVADPTLPGTTTVERAWHFLLAAHESGYMYYGTSLDFEIKPTLAANRAVEHADSVIATGPDLTPPTIWLPQRLPWNPGGKGGGSLWGYPGGSGAAMSQDFHVWTFVSDASGVDTVRLVFRFDADGVNPLASTENETYAGGPEVGAWRSLGMTRRAFPAGNVYNNPSIDFSVMPAEIADEYWALVAGLADTLVDYYVEAVDAVGNVGRSPIQHVWVGSEGGSGSPVATWQPTNPVAGESLAISYDAVAGALPDGTNPVYIHIGHSGWTNILVPDPAMTYDAGTGRWTYTYAIPQAATSVDFVFTNGAGAWDNNGGADWHVTVTGGAPPAHAIDGALDAGAPVVASCGGRDLHAEYDGAFLYVAAPGVSGTLGVDHFVMVARPGTTGTRAAPWAKAGTVAALDLFLGNEDSNNWAGWFDAAEAQVSTGVEKASGAWLEGLVDVAAVWGAVPDSVRVAFAGYSSPDGGALQAQAPCGDGNGNVEAGEWVWVAPSATGVADGSSAGDADASWGGTAPEGGAAAPPAGNPIEVLSGNPSRGAIRWRVAALPGERLVVDLLDASGRRVARLFEGTAPGPIDSEVPQGRLRPGTFLIRVEAGGRASVRKVTIVR